jgi:hypothetical protein
LNFTRSRSTSLQFVLPAVLAASVSAGSPMFCGIGERGLNAFPPPGVLQTQYFCTLESISSDQALMPPPDALDVFESLLLQEIHGLERTHAALAVRFLMRFSKQPTAENGFDEAFSRRI